VLEGKLHQASRESEPSPGAEMNYDDEKNDPAGAILIILLVWSLFLAMGALGLVTRLVAERGCM